jgi:heme exporter protein A
MKPTPAIQTKGLSKGFGARLVLKGIDLEVAQGETVALMGANGSGKTTLLRCLAALTRPTAGEVRWFGHPAAADASARRLVGMVAHENAVYPHLTVSENLIFAARMYGLPRPAHRAEDLIRRFGLWTHALWPAVRLSRGMRQRLALARALIHEPPILLLDEPFSGLDRAGSELLIALVSDLRARDRTVCFASHDPQIAYRLAGRVLCLESGRLHVQGSGFRVQDAPPATRHPLPATRAA